MSVLEVNDSPLLNSERRLVRDTLGRFSSGGKSFSWLLDDTLVSDWINAYTSEETREKKLYQLEKLLKAGGLKTPSELLRLDDRETKLLAKRLANSYLQNGKAVWAKQIIITARGFLEANDRRLDFKRSERLRTTPRKKIVIEHIPTKLDVYRMADNAGSARNRALILCLFQAGIRVGCLCNWTYGLFGEQLFPELRVPLRIRVTPAMDSKLNLYGLAYYVTGLQLEAAQSLHAYVESRKRSGWSPQATDWIFVTERGADPGSKLKREGVWSVVKNVARKSGLDPRTVWTHCFRKSFRKVLNSTPQIDEDTKEALMGHKLPGSRGNYFDYHDEDEVMAKYMQANFARNGQANDVFSPSRKN